jgi:membrane protein insertase Oxa1/YidC/SpoIIIJ
MLLPWPILIALVFVFQNTIELRGVPFARLPDLSAKGPLFILPVLLGVSMFLIQWVSLRTMRDAPPKMKMRACHASDASRKAPEIVRCLKSPYG